MDSENLHERIEAYLARKMSAADRVAFETELESDAALRAELKRHQNAAVALRYGWRRSLKQRLTETEHALANGRTYRIRIIRRVAVAASVLLVIAAGLHFYAHHTYRNTAIAGYLFEPTLTEVFRNAEPGDVSSIEDRFVLAEALFREGDFDQARQYYLELVKEETLLKSKAEWNLLMCYLAMDPHAPQFRVLSERILNNPQHDYHERAIALQKSMNTTWYQLVNR